MITHDDSEVQNERLIPHPDLVDAHKLAACHEGVGGCCCKGKVDNVCSNFVGCGPTIRCGFPCRHCLAWTGYGGDEVVDELKQATCRRRKQ